MRTECEAVFLFIAELAGSFEAGTGNREKKIDCGVNNYLDNYLHDLDLSTEEGRKDLHENVWLERLYEELDSYFRIPVGHKLARALCIDLKQYREESYKWVVPIELDASALMLAH